MMRVDQYGLRGHCRVWGVIWFDRYCRIGGVGLEGVRRGGEGLGGVGRMSLEVGS